MPISQIVTNSIANGAVVTVDIANGAVTSEKMAAGAARANFGAGAVLQVVQVVKTDAFAGSAGAVWSDVSGMSASITPTSASSRVLIMVDMKGAGGANYSIIRSRLLRGSTPIYVGDAASNRPRSMGQFYGGADGGADIFYLAQLGGTFLDSPATTSSTTYKIQIGGDGNAQVIFINRTQGDRNDAYFDSRVSASITLIEIAA